mmetsp:Transcript_120630/g.341077  ORF Transcript_120630/g.341077 Transcript_120630/m.341077 type:complete len:386 (-) Transcript_120630:137-1294(-)
MPRRATRLSPPILFLLFAGQCIFSCAVQGETEIAIEAVSPQCGYGDACDVAVEDDAVHEQSTLLLQKALLRKGLQAAAQTNESRPFGGVAHASEPLIQRLDQDFVNVTSLAMDAVSATADIAQPAADAAAGGFGARGGCKDTPGWTNGYNCRAQGKSDRDGCSSAGWTCYAYEKHRWCSHGRPTRGKEWAFTSDLRQPEKNCCACGKSSGSCSDYGCGGNYKPWQACQCTPECSRYNNCCDDYQSACVSSGGERYMTGYHQTSKDICESIMKSNFRRGSGGWCGGAIYFAMSPEATKTKAIAASSHDGCMIEAKVNVGRQKRAGRDCDHYNADKVRSENYDSVIFNPGDGDEIVVYDPSRVVSKKILRYNEAWRVPSLRRRRRGN